MKRLVPIINLIGHYKYVITIVVGVLVVGFLDEDSFVRRVQLELQISDMNAEIEKYRSIYESDSKQLRELRTNPEAFEKIARERYFMKADDEDIYVLSDDSKPETDNDETVE